VTAQLEPHPDFIWGFKLVPAPPPPPLFLPKELRRLSSQSKHATGHRRSGDMATATETRPPSGVAPRAARPSPSAGLWHRNATGPIADCIAGRVVIARQPRRTRDVTHPPINIVRNAAIYANACNLQLRHRPALSSIVVVLTPQTPPPSGVGRVW
jgi:hypothetical protein